MGAIQRQAPRDGGSYAVDTNVANSSIIEYGSASGGTIHVPNGSTITTLEFHSVSTGSNYQVFDKSNIAVTLTVAANRCYPIPAECFGCAQLRLKGNAVGSVIVTLKG